MKLNERFLPVVSKAMVVFFFAYIAGIYSLPASMSVQHEKKVLMEAKADNTGEENELKQGGNEPKQEEISGTIKPESSLLHSQSKAESTFDENAQQAGKDEKTEKSITQATQRQTPVKASRGDEIRRKDSGPLKWFGTVDKLFRIGTNAKVTDVETGISFEVKRTYGINHADVETLTPGDTAVLKQLAGGEWSWKRRAVIVNVRGTQIAASMNMMPHAGIDTEPENREIEERSGGYGPGTNLDRLKGNEMDGHFCIHFFGSKTHDSDQIDEQHQEMVIKANEWLLKNGKAKISENK